MLGPPKDKEGECNARLCIGDDYGDNRATMRCSLPEGHDGLHREQYDASYDESKTNLVTITWECDARNRCHFCNTVLSAYGLDHAWDWVDLTPDNPELCDSAMACASCIKKHNLTRV